MMRDDDIMILKAALLYIIQKSEERRHDVYDIVKTAFFAQQIHLSKSGSPLFNDEICALPFGPVPSSMYNILKMARGDEKEMSFHLTDGLKDVADAIGWKDMLSGSFVMHLLYWCDWDGSKNESLLNYITTRCKGKIRVVKMGAVMREKRMLSRKDNVEINREQNAFNQQIDDFVD